MKKQPVRTSSAPRTITPVVLVKVTGRKEPMMSDVKWVGGKAT